MILFELKCAADHRFEAWFQGGAAYGAQAEAGKIACPVCGDTRVAKAPMAPRISRSAGAPGAEPSNEPETRQPDPGVAASPGATPPAGPRSGELGSGKMMAVAGELRETLRELRRHVERNADYVGSDFAQEARKIYYGETEERSIYGEASDDEAEELVDEGVPVSRIPWVPKHDS